ncbi:MAG: hypothetical protein AMJ53_17890 [Gammaproteobacteria bacterium SG8_11]|nr:MAG: hypothetical protein AMJ53_17890 [Gammaproteobacteria bacterium SG8_11]
MPDTMSKRTTIGFIIGIIAILLIVTTLILPWYGMHSVREDKDLDGDFNYYYESGYGVSVTGGIGYYGSSMSLYSGAFSTPALFGITTLLMVMALICTALFIAMVFLYEMEKIRSLKLAKILCILALIFCLLAPIIFAVALPGAMRADAEKRAEDSDQDYESPDHDDPTKSFFGYYKDVDEDEYEIETTEQSWGGDIGWFMAFVAFALICVSFFMTFPKTGTEVQPVKRYPVRSPEPQPQPEATPTYPQQQQYQQPQYPQQQQQYPPQRQY